VVVIIKAPLCYYFDFVTCNFFDFVLVEFVALSFTKFVDSFCAQLVYYLVFGLHKVWTDRCKKLGTPCTLCNSEPKEQLFQTAIEIAAACAHAEFFNTYGLTNTYRARLDGIDALHYGRNTSWMESQVLLNSICEPDLEPVEFPPPVGDCLNYGFDKQLAEAGEAGPCVAHGWNSSHNRRLVELWL